MYNNIFEKKKRIILLVHYIIHDQEYIFVYIMLQLIYKTEMDTQICVLVSSPE